MHSGQPAGRPGLPVASSIVAGACGLPGNKESAAVLIKEDELTESEAPSEGRHQTGLTGRPGCC